MKDYFNSIDNRIEGYRLELLAEQVSNKVISLTKYKRKKILKKWRNIL